MRPALFLFASLAERVAGDRRLPAILWLLLAIQIGVLAKAARFAPHLLPVAFTAEAGVRESLPEEVVLARTLLRQHDVTEFAVAGDPSRNKHFVRRLTEAAYPTRFAKESNRVIARAGDPVPSGCSLRGESGGVGLYDCAASD